MRAKERPGSLLSCRPPDPNARQEILERSVGSPLKVIAIWTEKIPFDSRRRWNAAGLADRRVEHLWDEQNIAGEWLAKNAEAASDWDFYMLFGPEAQWEDKPSPLLGSGASVLGEKEQLRSTIQPLVRLSSS